MDDDIWMIIGYYNDCFLLFKTLCWLYKEVLFAWCLQLWGLLCLSLSYPLRVLKEFSMLLCLIFSFTRLTLYLYSTLSFLSWTTLTNGLCGLPTKSNVLICPISSTPSSTLWSSGLEFDIYMYEADLPVLHLPRFLCLSDPELIRCPISADWRPMIVPRADLLSYDDCRRCSC